jgi:hypothetical protein
MWTKGLTGVVLAAVVLAAFGNVKAAATDPLPIRVAPFYDSKGPRIDVGKFSEQLTSANTQSIKAVIEAMQEEYRTLSAVAMYVASIRLYDLGYRDNAVRWFYAADHRARVFEALVDPRKTMPMTDGTQLENQLLTAHLGFRYAREYIEGYAGCDRDKWIAALERVGSENRSLPDLKAIYPSVAFVPADRWAKVPERISAGLEKFAQHIYANWPELKAQRVKNKSDERFCQP